MKTISDPTDQYEKNVHPFLDYMATYPNTAVRFNASDMILRADTVFSYLTEPESFSSATGWYYFGSETLKCAQEHLNVPIHLNCNILKSVTASDAEAETGGCLVIGIDTTILRKHSKINGPPTAHYTSMHVQYDSRCNYKVYNHSTSITCNGYALFLDSLPKKLWEKSHCIESRTITSCRLFYKASFWKHIINVYWISIYIQIKRHGQSHSSYLSRPCKVCWSRGI